MDFPPQDDERVEREVTDSDGRGAVGAAAVTGRELIVSRLFSAPRELLFEAWTDPGHLSRWWGPPGYTTTTVTMDVRPGGVWRYVIHGPDGTDYQNEIRYREVLEPQRLEYSHGSGQENDPDQFDVTVTFADTGRGTELTVSLLFATVAERATSVEEYGADEGVNQTLDRLVDHLSAMRQE